MEVTKIPISDINININNPRKNLRPGDTEYEKLKKSILAFDMVEPLVWNKRTGNLVSGHQRLNVLKEIGKHEVEVSVVDLDEVKEKALSIALNKIEGEWDYPKLREALEELDTGEIDMELTGFDESELEELLSQVLEPYDIENLLEEIDLSNAVERPLWVVIRTTPAKQEILERVLALLEKENIRVERSYEV